MYDKVGKTSFGVYREDRNFKPSGELIAQVFSGASWDTIPIIGNWHMELDDRLNWLNLWKPDTSCDTSTCDTCGSIQPSCWRNKIWNGNENLVSFAWDTTKNFTPDGDSVHIGFQPRASLKISFALESTYDTCVAFWYFRCCEGGVKQHTAVAPGVFYACSAHVWYEGEIDSVGLGFRWYDVNGDTIGTTYRYISTSSLTAQQWELITDTCTAPVSPDSAYSCIISINAFTIGDTVGVDTGSVWIDDVQLYEALKWKTYYPDSVVVDTGSIAWESIDWQEVEDSLSTDDGRYLTIEAESTEVHWKTDWHGVVTIDEDREDVKRLWVGYDGHYSTGDVDNPKIQTIYLKNWISDVWDTLCAAANDTSCWSEIRRADITHGWSTADTSKIKNYISDPGKKIWLRVVTEDTVATYNCLADYMRFSVEFVPQQQ
jgi:hypothetical protein